MSFNKFYNLSTDNTLGGLNPSNYVAVSEKAIKEYVDNHSGGGGTVDQTYDPTSTKAQSGVAIAEAGFLTSASLTNYVTLNTSQKILAAKAIFGNDVAFGTDTTQKNLLAVISNSNSMAGNWIGRLAVGAKNKTFIMGTYGGICVLGAHAWTNAQQGTGAAWEPVYINPDGDKAVYIGGSPINGKQPLMILQNVNANTTGRVLINRSTNLSNNFKDAACWDDNISKFNNDANYTSVYESTVSDWGFTKNTGTVTSINNVQPINGNITIKTINSTSLLGSGNIRVLTNTGSDSDNSFGVGPGSNSNGLYSVAVGDGAKTNAEHAIMIGYGTNSTSRSLKVSFSDVEESDDGKYILLDGTTGLIPDARLSSNIARISNVADTSLSNLDSTGQAVIDGQWVYINQEICQGRNSETSDKTWSLNLPDDSYDYEVLLVGAVTTGATSGNQARINLQSSIIQSNIVICNAQTRTSSTVTAYGTCIIPVGRNHNITVKGWGSNTGGYSLYFRGYRRIGTNS